MLSSRLPKLASIADVQPGSLVLVPGQNQWAIGMEGEQLFFLENGRPGYANGQLADFGRAYKIQVDLMTASRALYPFAEEDCAGGDLIMFPDNGGTNCSVISARATGTGQLTTFDIFSGTERKRGSSDGEGLAYRGWQITFPASDAANDAFSIFSRKP